MSRLFTFNAFLSRVCMFVTAVADDGGGMCGGAGCNQLAFTNCDQCTDMTDTQPTSHCTSCVSGYALKDDNSTCTSTYQPTSLFRCPLKTSAYLFVNSVTFQD